MKNNKLSKITSKKSILSIIENTKSNEKKVTAWRIIEGKKQTVELFIRVIRVFRDEFVVRVKEDSSKDLFKNLHISLESINIFFPNDLTLFQAKIKSRSIENGDLTLEFPKMIAQVDRRKSLRYEFDEEDEVSISILKNLNLLSKKKQVFNKKINDLSSGGFSFFISKTEKSFFKESELFENVEVSLDETPIDIKFKVLSCVEVRAGKNNDLAYSVYKVAAKFQELNIHKKSLIEEYVFQKIDFNKAV